jgi:hypothetical protein
MSSHAQKSGTTTMSDLVDLLRTFSTSKHEDVRIQVASNKAVVLLSPGELRRLEESSEAVKNIIRKNPEAMEKIDSDVQRIYV